MFLNEALLRFVYSRDTKLNGYQKVFGTTYNPVGDHLPPPLKRDAACISPLNYQKLIS